MCFPGIFQADFLSDFLSDFLVNVPCEQILALDTPWSRSTPRLSESRTLGYTFPPMNPEDLDRAVAAFRTWLALPLESMFQTAEDLQGHPPPPKPTLSVQRSAPGEIVMTQGHGLREIPPEARRSVIDTISQPESLLLTVRQGRRTVGPIMQPVMFVISSPLTTAEREQLRRQQAATVEQFDRCIAATRGVLLGLVKDGADPFFLLSILVRYASTPGTVFPSFQEAVLPRSQFAFQTPLSWVKPHQPLEPVRLAGWTPAPSPAPRKRRGPAGIGANVGMALLAQHLHVATKRGGPHATELAALFTVWGRDLRGLNREIVYRRITRVKQEHATEFRQLTRDDARQVNAERVFFKRFAQP